MYNINCRRVKKLEPMQTKLQYGNTLHDHIMSPSFLESSALISDSIVIAMHGMGIIIVGGYLLHEIQANHHYMSGIIRPPGTMVMLHWQAEIVDGFINS